jgi:hypothetical protein
MRLVRAAAIALLSFAAMLAAVAAIVMYNQARVISLVLQHIQESSGYQIVASGARLHFGPHLSVVLDHPIILHDGREFMRSERVRVYVSYHALIWNSGLPLRALVIERPELHAPATSGALSLNVLRDLDTEPVRAMADAFREFTGLVERVTIANARVSDPTGVVLLEDFSLTAAPRRRHATIWEVGFIAPHIHALLSGLELSGRTSIDTTRPANQIISNGELWFWNGRLDRSAGAGLTVNGLVHGDATFALRGSGELDGHGNLAVDQLEVGGARVSKPIDLGNCSLKTLYALSTQRAVLTGVEVRSETTSIASGDIALNDPFGPDATVLAHLSGIRIDLAALKARLAMVRALPKPLAWLAVALVSGRVTVAGATYQSRLKDAAWSAAALSDALELSARLEAVSLKLPDTPALPALSQANTGLYFAKGRLRLSQGSAALGRSSFQELSGTADFASGQRQVRYQLKAAGTLDLGELYPAATQLFPAVAAKASAHIERLDGNTPVRVTASGSLDINAPAPPSRYKVEIDTSGINIATKDLPHPIALFGGSVMLTPGNIELSGVMARIAKPEVPGNVALNGKLAFDAGGFSLRQIAVEMHQIEVQQWLPLLIDPQDISARGPLGGTLTIVREAARRHGIRANGRLTMGAGEIQLGFLRAPIVAQSATLTFDGRGLLLSIVGAKLQEAPLDFSLGVADLDKPVLRILANSGRLDLEVMKFVRLPWAPSPPAHFFPVPVIGHISANHATLERLAMSRVNCDFNREVNGDWAVRNFTATFFDGRANLEFSGRGRDDWINVKGAVNGVQVAPIFNLANPAAPPPLSGRLKAKGDLWANANTDFFRTLAGTISIEVTDGVLHKFALLSRILGFVDLKTWLSAKVPDPRINGVPFQTLTANFKGQDGDFYSDNLLLRGPVMNISAMGHIRLYDSNVDMQVGMVPFKTVNWLVAKVPIIGGGLATDHFVAAYFHVTGPLNDPYVIPLPITSAAHFLTNVLKLPINIINGIGNEINQKGGGPN